MNSPAMVAPLTFLDDERDRRVVSAIVLDSPIVVKQEGNQARVHDVLMAKFGVIFNIVGFDERRANTMRCLTLPE
jgi:hypothetical protein